MSPVAVDRVGFWASGRRVLRSAVLGWITFFNVLPPLQAQEILGTCGTPLGELEPWGIPADQASADVGVSRRLVDIMLPSIARLDAAEAKLQALDKAQDRSVQLDAFCSVQADVCADVVSLIGTLKKHQREVQSWGLDPAVGSAGGTGDKMVEQILAQALAASGEGVNAPPRTVKRWRWCAAVWSPFNCAVQFEPGEERILQELGFAVALHAADPDWVWSAFLMMLRQTAVASGEGLQPAGVLSNLLAGDLPRQVEMYGLGKAALGARFNEQMHLLVGWRTVAGLLNAEFMNTWRTEGGEYVYRSLRGESEETVQRCMASALLTGVLRGGFVLRGTSAEALMKAHDYRSLCYGIIEAEQARRFATVPGARLQIEQLYEPYLAVLAAFPPCLSPYRVETVNQDWLKCAAEKTGQPSSVVGSDKSPAPSNAVPHGVSSLLCLLQSDCWRADDGVWQWSPRFAGSRMQLDRFLNSLAPPPASSGKEAHP